MAETACRCGIRRRRAPNTATAGWPCEALREQGGELFNADMLQGFGGSSSRFLRSCSPKLTRPLSPPCRKGTYMRYELGIEASKIDAIVMHVHLEVDSCEHG